MSIQRDWLQRLIEQLAAAVARVLGLRREGRLEEARQELERAAVEAAGLGLSLLERLDPASAARLVREPERLAALARLALERSRLERDAGEVEAAGRWHERAVALGDLSTARGAAADPEVLAARAGPC